MGIKTFCVALICYGLTGSGWAWSDHALAAWPALRAMPQMRALPPVKAETLEQFLAANRKGVADVLAQQERWARQNVPNYPSLPEALAFKADKKTTAAQLRDRFAAATRINPQTPLPLFVALDPGAATPSRKPRLDSARVSILPLDGAALGMRFVGLKSGERVSVIDVVVTACDEPDFGLDIGLWSDSGTAWGQRYGMGELPFGNPAVIYTTQAPLHMGFYYEPSVAYAAAPYLKRTYPEWRIHLWRSLAVYALSKGHNYWGWRFAGWAAHYAQDLTQPYHARVLPGVNIASMFGTGVADILGWHGPKNNAVVLVSNRHLALENIQRKALQS